MKYFRPLSRQAFIKNPVDEAMNFMSVVTGEVDRKE
jgi:hypothetical protein